MMEKILLPFPPKSERLASGTSSQVQEVDRGALAQDQSTIKAEPIPLRTSLTPAQVARTRAAWAKTATRKGEMD